MVGSNALKGNEISTTSELIKAVVCALVIALTLLFTAILPAEYGIDPTGFGDKLGLLKLTVKESSGSSDNFAVSVASDDKSDGQMSADPVWKASNKYRQAKQQLTLLPNQGLELKAVMDAGERLLFSWQVDNGSVSFDMHGERVDAGKEFSSYWTGDDETQANGELIAPFAGTHGWYWKNNGTEAVTINLRVAGFYRGLYMP